MSNNEEEETEQLDLAKVKNYVSENHATLKMAPVNESQDTIDRPIPIELLNRATPRTDKMAAIVDISASLLESVPPQPNLKPSSERRIQSDLDATVEMAKFVPPAAAQPDIEFSGTIDASGRIQLPASYLTDQRVRPGRKMKIRIEFID